MLYRPEAFEPLTDERWDEQRVRERIRAIVADTDTALRGPKLLWRADDWDRWTATSPLKNLYVGAAGVLFALDELRRKGLSETRLDLAGLALRTLELQRERPDYPKGIELPRPREASLFCGEAGILLVAWRLGPSSHLADDLHALVRANDSNEAEEIMWGSPGTLVAARAMLEWTGKERWRDACRDAAEALWSRRGEDGLWVQRLFGRENRSLTPPHGLVGIVEALGRVLDDERRATLERDSAAILRHAATVDDGLANWPPSLRPDLPGPDGQIRLQWCAGAPGIVHAARAYLDEDLLLAGAELVWRAGPHGDDKGPSICHGTAGNGYALLAAFERTGDEEWLARSRRFAMHALRQVERQHGERGRGRYSLWTGDLGVALYAAACLEGRPAFPVLESAL